MGMMRIRPHNASCQIQRRTGAVCGKRALEARERVERSGFLCQAELQRAFEHELSRGPLREPFVEPDGLRHAARVSDGRCHQVRKLVAQQAIDCLARAGFERGRKQQNDILGVQRHSRHPSLDSV